MVPVLIVVQGHAPAVRETALVVALTVADNFVRVLVEDIAIKWEAHTEVNRCPSYLIYSFVGFE